MKKKSTLFLLAFYVLSESVFSQSAVSQFADPSGQYSMTGAGVCLFCGVSNPEYIADNDMTNYASVTITAGVVFTEKIRVKLNSVASGGTRAGFYLHVANLVSALPGVTLSTYKAGVFQETIVSGGSLLVLLGSTTGCLSGQTSAARDYDELELILSGGLLSAALQADLYFGFGGGSYCSPTTLPLNFLHTALLDNGTQPAVSWVSEDEGTGLYEVQRSDHASDFTTIGMVISGENAGEKNLSFKDPHAVEGMSYYYRVVLYGRSSEAAVYSEILHYIPGGVAGASRFSSYPNPLRGLSMTVKVPAAAHGGYTLELIDLAGKALFSQVLVLSGTEGERVVSLPAKPAPGIYFLRMVPAGGGSAAFIEKLVIE